MFKSGRMPGKWTITKIAPRRTAHGEEEQVSWQQQDSTSWPVFRHRNAGMWCPQPASIIMFALVQLIMLDGTYGNAAALKELFSSITNATAQRRRLLIHKQLTALQQSQRQRQRAVVSLDDESGATAHASRQCPGQGDGEAVGVPRPGCIGAADYSLCKQSPASPNLPTARSTTVGTGAPPRNCGDTRHD